ncbi:MAG: surface-adhesin E family protein [Candidatus Gastranaerophilaceae bacterium]
MKKIIVLCFLILLAMPAVATEWMQIGPKVWLDLSTRDQHGNIVSAWVKSLNDGSFKLLENQKVYYHITRYNANCSNRTLSISSSVAYNYKKDVMARYDVSDKSFLWNWDAVVPDTFGEHIYTALCSF